MSKLRLFSTYTGYGGAEWALKKSGIGFEVIGYSEIHKGQIKIYEQNFKGHKNFGDITKVDVKDIPDFDIVTGGFPCQDVSMAGLRDLSKGRTKSVFKLLEIIKVKKPKYVLLENVEGILSMLNGELIKEIVRFLKNCNYAVSYKLLYSKDYGIPQNRPRVFIAAELNREAFLFNPFPNKEELKLKVSDLLEKNVDKQYYKSEKFMDWWIKRFEETTYTSLINNINIANTLTASTSYHDNNLLICSSQPRTGDPKKGGTGPLFRDDNIAYTIDTSNTQFIIQNKNKFRSLTPRECFRLQGFLNDEINIENIPKTIAYFSAGNGWDINLVSKIFTKWLGTSYNKDYTNKDKE